MSVECSGGARPAPPLISLAMIVKDESAHLPECLAGIARLADEICIVDTGSEDDTVAIAQAFGAKVDRFTWCDDFAAARNASLAICTGQWIFVSDADEWIAEADVPRIRALTQAGPARCYRFITRNYTDRPNTSGFVPCAAGNPFARGFPGWFPSGKVRLFPNGLGAHFEGKVHEMVNRSLLERGLEVVTSEAPIHHYPLTKSPERVRRKQALYLALGHEELRLHPEDPRAAANLADQYAEVGDYKNAAGLYRQALRSDPSNAVWMKDMGGALHLMGRSEEARKALELALRADPALGEAWRNLGVIHADRGAWDDAVACFERAAALNPESSEARQRLSVAYEGAGRLADAAHAASEALRRDTRCQKSLHLYVNQMAALRREEEARGFLERLVKEGVASPELLGAYEDHCRTGDSCRG